MNNSMNVTIRRLTNTFIVLFLILSGVAAYVQIQNQAFYNGPVLAAGQFDPRTCPPYDQPVRGTIYDRNGVKLAWSEPDPASPCGYRRRYADPTLAPLIGYFSYRYGTAGVEQTFNDQLAGIQHGETTESVLDKLLHKPRRGQDVYLTIDERVQQQANKYYDASAIYNASAGNNGVCQDPGTNPPGSITVEDPKTGEILAMVSRPYYDPNTFEGPDANADQAAWEKIQSDPGHPLINHATQAVYDPGSTFKTLTLLAALDTGKYSLNTQFSQDDATRYVVNGEHINWDDYFAHVWDGLVHFPITLAQSYAYSDNVVFARAASTLGADTWLSYVRKFGIATPGTDVPLVPFDGDPNQRQSIAYPAVSGGPTQFTGDDLAASGFGQGALLITPLTMSEVTASIAANGVLYDPYSVLATEPHTEKADLANATTTPTRIYGNGPIFQPQTASAVRQAMYAVTSYGTAQTYGSNPDPINGQNYTLATSPAHQGGKTGTGQIGSGGPRTWYISLAPDDAAPGGGAAHIVVTVQKENNSGDGGCQVYVADNTEVYAMDNKIGPFGNP